MAAKWTYPLAFGGALLMMLSVELLMPRVPIQSPNLFQQRPGHDPERNLRTRCRGEIVLTACLQQPHCLGFALDSVTPLDSGPQSLNICILKHLHPEALSSSKSFQ